MRCRIVFMGTPEFSVASLETCAREGEVVGVYTQPDRAVGRGLELRPSPVKKKAEQLGFPVFQPERLSLPGEFEKLEALKPDVIVVVAYGQILKRNVLSLPRLGCVNVHSSLLPRWRGAAPIQHAILGGDAETGITTMYMAEKLDAGDILLQARTPISQKETASSLHDRLALMGAETLARTLHGLISGEIKPEVQDEGKVTYASKLEKEMEALSPSLTAIEADRRVRALNPWPGTSVQWAGEGRLRIKAAQLRADVLSGTPGTLFERHGMLLLGFREGALEVLRLQQDGKKEIDAAGFLNGLKGRGLTLPQSWT